LRARYKVLVAGSVATALLVIASCGEVAQNLDTGARCSLNSDCKTPLVCGFERCRAQCNTSRDCGGKLCVRSETNGQSANVCQLEDEVECTHNSQCPGSQLCGPDRHCRDVCITDKDCVTDLLCVSRVCAKPEELRNGALPQRSPVDAGASCTYATDCPNDLVCLYGRCDVECLGPKDCLVGWTCKAQNAGGDGRCYPTANTTTDAGARDGGESPLLDATADGGPIAPRALQMALREEGTCALLDNGKIKCFGGRVLGYGDLAIRGDGPGEMGDRLPYVDLGTGVLAQGIAAGRFWMCALLTDGRVKCWGENFSGQLGIEDTLNRGGEPNQMSDVLPFVSLGTGRTAKALTGGDNFTCALLDNAQIKCWGTQSFGQLGTGGSQSRGSSPNTMGDNLPTVSLGTGRSAKQVSAGAMHACALLDNDQVKCWGYNVRGQLGYGDTLNRGRLANTMGDDLPVVNLGTGRSAKRIVAGGDATCAVLDDGTLKCWGQLFGLGDASVRGDEPNEMGDALPGVDLGLGRTIKDVMVAGGFACALLDNGELKCWGGNFSGNLGLGDTQTRGSAPGQMGANLPAVLLGTGRTAQSLAASAWHVCAILDNRAVKCWGDNTAGQLGLGDTMTRGDMPNQMGDTLPIVKLN